jgi:hypothetical protein
VKKTIAIIGTLLLVFGSSTIAFAATSARADVSTLAAAESNVVALLHQYKDTPSWKARFKSAMAKQNVELARVKADLTTGTSNTTPTTSKATTSGGMTSFGDGTRLVGKASGDIAPGTYRTAGQSGCYWARLSGLGGSLSDIIANDDAVGPAIVTIDATDKAFDSQGCGTWGPLPTTGPQATRFGDGTWAVGIEIAPDTYQAPGGSGCYWARLSAFGGGLSGIIANDDAAGAVLVSIASTDKGFETKGCGTFTKSG